MLKHATLFGVVFVKCNKFNNLLVSFVLYHLWRWCFDTILSFSRYPADNFSLKFIYKKKTQQFLSKPCCITFQPKDGRKTFDLWLERGFFYCATSWNILLDLINPRNKQVHFWGRGEFRHRRHFLLTKIILTQERHR